MTLAALLEELKVADPETYEDIGDIANVISILSDGSFSSDAYYPDFIVQGCVQRACERREWHWLVCMDCWREGEYRAEISIISESCISSMVEVNEIAMKWGNSPAEALLVAYIAAVREEAKR